MDQNGHQIYSTDFSRNTSESSDGETEYIETFGEHHIGSDNRIIPSAQAFGRESSMQVCDCCVKETKTFSYFLLHRNQPRITWSLSKSMRRCFSCRKSLCEKHYVLTVLDKRIRCKACDRKFRRNQLLKSFLKQIFLERINHE
jgi:hypothetical protein